MNSTHELSGLLSPARAAIAFTGAGISTESGLSDFRSPGGIWAKHRPVMYDEFLASRDARVRYWEMRSLLYPEIAGAKPNAGHRAIARLEQLGIITAVVTQNIDGLHQDAGSRDVIELHGTARIVACVGCGRECSPEQVISRIDDGDEAPDCEDCGAPLKSKTVSFGQAMPEAEMARAGELARRADVCLAIGSSLVVEPAASVPRLAQSSGATLVIINNTPTPLDDLADLVIREPIGDVLTAVMARLDV